MFDWVSHYRQFSRVRTASVCVKDQQRAVDFYTGKLGFEKHRDDPMGPGARWIELATPKGDTMLVPFTPPGMENRIGTFTGIVLEADNIQKTYEDLRAKGVEFTQAPEKQPWGGTLAQFKDMDGNGFVIVEQGA